MISIIIPVYNTEKYINECVTSILKQSYKDYEIILVDDGSTDNSPDICNHLAKQYDCVKVIHKKNEGAGIARNRGLSIAKGKYVTFIDSDDYIGSEMLESLLKNIEERNSDLCIGGTVSINLNKQIIHTEKYSTLQIYKNKDEIVNNLIPRIFGSSPKKHDAIKIGNCNNLFKMDIIRRNDLAFESERKVLSEDLIWLINYLMCAKKAIVINSTEYYVRVNQTSMTHRYNPERFKLTIIQYERMEDYIKLLELDDKTIYRLKKQFFINIRECIKQENNCNFLNAYSHIKKMVNNEKLLFIISDYPINQLGYKQKVFLKLLRKKRKIILCLLTKLKII